MGRKDPFTPVTHTDYVAHNNAKEVQIYNATGTPITKGTNGIGTTNEQEFKSDNTTETTINHLIQNPSTHYSRENGANGIQIASAGYNNTTREGDWWNPTVKTLYDPCPNGYRIPKGGTYGEEVAGSTYIYWSAWSEGGLISGRVWTPYNVSTFFPTGGQRYRDSGRFAYVGVSNRTWMSTTVKGNYRIGHSIIFDAQGVISNYLGAPHSHSYTVRCIKD